MHNEQFRELLSLEFDRKKQLNTALTRNKFAKLAGVSSGTMSELLSGRRGWAITPERALAIVEKISTTEEIKNKMLLALGRVPKIEKTLADESKYKFLTSWKHRAVFMALELADAQNNPEDLCRRFSLSMEELHEIYDEGLGCGIFSQDEEGSIKSQKRYWTTQDNVPSEIVRQHHIQNLDQIKSALENIPFQRRDCTSLTFVGSAKKIEAARKELRACYDRINSLMYDQTDNDEVFQLSISLIPLSQEPRS